jgi:hypothetical protein
LKFLRQFQYDVEKIAFRALPNPVQLRCEFSGDTDITAFSRFAAWRLNAQNCEL